MSHVLPVPERRLLQVLDARVHVTTDARGLLEALDARLGPFVSAGDTATAPDDRDTVEVRLSPGPPQMRKAGQLIHLSGVDPVEQAFSAVFREVVDRIERYLLVHAAAVAGEAGAFLLAGSSGSGKTTLCLLLAGHGFRLLTDDFTPVERGTRTATPFPKALGVRHGAGSSAARRTAGATITGARGLLSHDGLPSEARASGPAPLRGIVFLDTEGSDRFDLHSPFRLGVRCAASSTPVRERMAGVAGIRLVAEQDDELTFEVDPRGASSRQLEAALAELADMTLEYGLVATTPPRGEQSPRLRHISPSQATALLLRELQNRRAGGRLLASVGGDPLGLLPEITAMIAGLPLARLEPGHPESTAALLAETFGRWAED